MDAVNVYEKYFSRKRDVICEVIERYLQEGKRLALWGAGARGQAFLNVFDTNAEKISYLYDKNANKYGTNLDTGHTITDYCIEQEADIVFVANNLYEFEVRHLLSEANYQAEVINIDNIILGDLDIDDIFNIKARDLSPVRNVKVCALVIIYNCGKEIVEYVLALSADIKKIYVYDNSEEENKGITEELKKIPGVEYIHSLQNNGLSIPINFIAQKAKSDKFDWMFTFDQDSKAQKDMVKQMLEFANSAGCDETVGIIAPVINEIDNENYQNEVYCTYFDKVYQSGAMHRLSLLDSVGGYDENLFIDQVDYEFCIRLTGHGYKIIKLNNAVLVHNIDDTEVREKIVDGKIVITNKYTSDRYYYIYRNNLYCYDKYVKENPIYALECLNNIEKIKLSAKNDLDSQEKLKALACAERDYREGKMGKRNAE